MREAEEIIARLIDKQFITGAEAIILMNACKVPQLFIPEKKEEKKWNGLNNSIIYNPGTYTTSCDSAYNWISTNANSTSCGG